MIAKAVRVSSVENVLQSLLHSRMWREVAKDSGITCKEKGVWQRGGVAKGLYLITDNLTSSMRL